MSPHILFVTHATALGGAELYLLDVAAHLRDRCGVAVFGRGPLEEKLKERGVSVHVLPAPGDLQRVRKTSGLWTGLYALPHVVRLTHRLRRVAADYDLLYANSQKTLIVGALAAWGARRPLIWNLHDVLTADHFSPFNRRLATTWANCSTDLVVCNSAATETSFRESGGRSPTAIVYNGFDPAPFDAVTPDDVARVRTSLGIGDAPAVGVYSRLAAWKGQKVLIDALPELPGVHALLVGDALFDGDARYADRLRTRVHRLGLSDRVHFLGFRDDIPRLMKAVDVVAHTSVAAEPFGRVIVEGLLAVRPVVATRAGGAVEIITDEVHGLLTPPGDVSALAQSLRSLLDDPARAARLARTGAAMARSRFSIAASAQSIETLSQQVVSRSSRAAAHSFSA